MDRRGVASIAILPSGSISGHFVDALTSQCFGLFGTQIACERECSRGEDYKLINLSILDFHSKKEVQVIVESRGQDAARFENATDIHGWEEDVMEALQRKDHGACVPSIKFECEILKADADAERHLAKYLPTLVGSGAVVNVGTMEIKCLKFERTHKAEDMEREQKVTSKAEFETTDNHEIHDDARDDNDSTTNGSRSELACDASTTTVLTAACSACVSLDKEFTGIFQKELEEQGLSMDGCPANILTGGWIEKKIMQQGSQNSFRE